MSIESRIEAVGRRVLRSPLWTGVVVTFFLVLPTLVVPWIPLWISMALLVTIGPPILVACYLVFGLCSRLFGVTVAGDETSDADTPPTPIEQLKRRYARGEIDEATFERRLDRLMDAEERARRTRTHDSAEKIEIGNR